MDELLDRPLTGRELQAVLMVVVTETVAALLPSKEADEALETIAGRLLDWSRDAEQRPLAAFFYALADMLVQTEEGSGV